MGLQWTNKQHQAILHFFKIPAVYAHRMLIYVKNRGKRQQISHLTIAQNTKSAYLCIVKRLIDCFRLVIIFIVLGF